MSIFTADGTLKIIPCFLMEELGNGHPSASNPTPQHSTPAVNGKTPQSNRASEPAARRPKTRVESGLHSGRWGPRFRDDPTYWPISSEWDFVEVVDGESVVYNTVHCGTDREEEGPCIEPNGLGLDSGDTGWERETLKWFIDGQQTWSVSGADVGDEAVWERVAHQGHFFVTECCGWGQLAGVIWMGIRWMARRLRWRSIMCGFGMRSRLSSSG
ncbi:hypothetical protein BJX70DRAFT_363005 [Aspergillus crustosus]